MKKTHYELAEQYNVYNLSLLVIRKLRKVVRINSSNMRFEIVSYTPPFNNQNCAIVMRFFPRKFFGIFKAAPCVSSFYNNGLDWFEVKEHGSEFLCDSETQKFLTLQRAEIETQLNNLENSPEIG